MPQVVEHLAALTAFRDRDELDASLVGALHDLLAPSSVAIYRCVGEMDDPRWLLRARFAPGDRVASADPVWAEIDSLPRLSDQPERQACLQSRQMRVVDGEPAFSRFPLMVEGEADGQGVLEIETPVPLQPEAVRLVGSILRIYRNFQSLLDYSERDTLTGLLNRKTFDGSFLRWMTPVASLAELPGQDAAGGARRTGHQGTLCLGIIDIDHFKRVNDNYGHLIGDEVLLLMARLMRSSFRFQDQLYRFGGEEFLVLMRCAQASDAAIAFERLRSIVAGHTFPQVGQITISVGYTELRPHDSPTSAFDRADKAVYHAKQHGRNQVQHHAALVAEGLLAAETHDSDIELF
jgi:diguanylate cyclase (GGDEF)-like protein